MAPPPQGQMRPGRQLAALAVLFVILGSLAYFGGKGSFSDRMQPRLGLDLVGGTRITLQAQPGTEGAPKLEDLEQARQVIEDRVNATGVTEAEVVVDGTQNIVITIAGKRDAAKSEDQAQKDRQEAIDNVGTAAQLFFRKVLKMTDGTPTQTSQPSPSASPSGSPKPSTAPSTSPSPKASGGGGGAQVSASPSAPASTAPSASPQASQSPAAPADPKAQDIIAAVKAKVGAAAWAAAENAAKGQAPVSDPTQLAMLQPFDKLENNEVAVLPAEMQFNIPFIDCVKLTKRPVGSIADEKKPVVACEGMSKYFLDVSKAAGPDISDAAPVRDQNGQWVVSLNFNGAGADKWTALTTEAVGNKGEITADQWKPGETKTVKANQDTLGDKGNARVAVVLDNTVISSPQIIQVLGSQSQITGNFDAKSAKQLADYLRFGSLKMSFKQLEAQTVSATLGADHLKAGLLAAGIGLLLVIIYSFFYYRLLGTVIFLSLVLSAALTFLALVFLGHAANFTLTLAGIAGFIVSLGVAADSFVIYFERLKDEIREGRSPRAAVQRAWIRARKTIITANAISLLAALVLYIISSGAVKGFAAALGIATVLDLVVVFLFRYPVMAMFARTKAFLSPRVSGLGRVLREAKEAN